MRLFSHKTIDVFFSLLRAGLWEKGIQLSSFIPIDYKAVYKLAEEQSVVGLVAAGLDHVLDIRVRKQDVIDFIGQTVHVEQRNKAMNSFIGALVGKMCEKGISAVLIKGQGVAQCYKRPLWRSAGDVDFLFNAEGYEDAKSLFIPLASPDSIKNVEDVKEFCITIDSWSVELHGSLSCRCSDRMDNSLDCIYKRICEGEVRNWRNDGQDVLLPSPDNDIFVIFTHIVKHFFKGGIGLRQICDWCRLIWTYRDSLDLNLLWKRLHEMGIITEWKAFAAFAIDYLGMPQNAMPYYDKATLWSHKARLIHKDILREGNFGHNRDKSYYKKYPLFIYKAISFFYHLRDAVRHSLIFPLDSWKVFSKVIFRGFRVLLNRL